MDRWQGKVALITGASSGIGAATARMLAREGWRVILVARRPGRLQALAEEIRAAGGKAQAIVADLAVEEERQRLFREVQASGGIDVLINNAGLGWYGYGADMPWPTARQMLEVNVAAVVHLTLLFLPEMRARNSGHIVNVGSIAGSLPSQGVALYSASKSFLDAFSTSLYREMRGNRVYVSIVRPGPVATEFFEAAADRSAGRRVPAEGLAVSPEAVACCICSLLRRPRRVAYVPGLLRFVPWVEPALGWLMDLLGPLLLRREQPGTCPPALSAGP